MNLSPTDRHRARQRLRDFHLRETAIGDLFADLDKRRNAVACYRADLDASEAPDADGGQVRGGIEYELWHIEAITRELERRQRAIVFGYRNEPGIAEDDLRERFDRAKPIDLVELIRIESGQVGSPAGNTWTFICPFHADGSERTPSLVAYPDGHFHCFGCGTHGTDPVAFLAELRGIGQVAALRLLESGVLGIGVPA
jgi:CHC2 zinc finger